MPPDVAPFAVSCVRARVRECARMSDEHLGVREGEGPTQNESEREGGKEEKRRDARARTPARE